MRSKKIKGKRLLALFLAVTLQISTVFTAGTMTVYATEDIAETQDDASEDVDASEDDDSKEEADEDETSDEEQNKETDDENKEQNDDQEAESEEESESSESAEEEESESAEEAIEDAVEVMALAEDDNANWEEAELCNIKVSSSDASGIKDNVYTTTAENGTKVKVAAYDHENKLKALSINNNGFSAGKWAKGDYYQITLSTEHFKENEVSFYLRSTKTSAKDFQISYSVDGDDYEELTDFSFEQNEGTREKTLPYMELDDADEQENVIIRIECVSDANVKGGTLNGEGNTNLNKIIIKGLTNGEKEDSGTDEDTPQREVVSIEDARKGVTDKDTFKVEGVVTFIDGKNVYIEDETAGIDLYFSNYQKDISIGDVIAAEGLLKKFNGLYELANVDSYEKKGTKELPVTEVTLKDLSEDYGKEDIYQSRRVLIKGVKLGAINTTGSTEITQADSKVNIYKIPASDAYAEGDKTDIYAVVSSFKALQLRVADEKDIKVLDKDPITEDMIPEGVHTIDYILDAANFNGSGNDINDDKKKATTTVIGQVTHIYGNNSKLNTAAISDMIDGETVSTIVYYNKAEFKAEVGDIITVTGTVKDYGKNDGKVRQVQDITEVKVLDYKVDAFEAEEVSIEDIETGEYVSDYVLLKNVTIGEYDAKNTTVKDADGKSITIYTGCAFPSTVKAGDTIDLYAVASKYDTNYQLRVGSEDCYVFVEAGKTEEPKEDQEFADPISDDMIPEGCNTIDHILTIDDNTIKNEDETYTVIGQIATKFGKYNNIDSCVIEDVIDGKLYALQVYNALADYKIGDVVTVTGTRSEYGKVVQIQGITKNELISDSVAPIDARVVDIDDLKTDKYISQYVVVKNVTLGDYNDNGSTKFKDAGGNEFPIFRAATYPDGVESGSVVDLYGVSSRYNDTFQMRVGYSTDYKTLGQIDVDKDYVLGIASIRGSFSEDLKTPYVYGDLVEENDQLDKNTKLTISEDRVPMITTKNGDVVTRTLGTNTLKEEGYYLIETSSSGYGAMNMEFQMRGSKTAPKAFQVLYSTDGKSYTPAGKTNVSASYTIYHSSTETENVTVDNDDKDGKFEMTADGKWHSVTVAIPDGAANADKLYIKVMVQKGSTAINGAAIGSGNNYFTTISLTGSPVVSDSICGFVKVSPEAGVIKANQALTLTSATKDAKIYYALNGGNFKEYSEENKPVIQDTDFPASLTCYAKKEGLADSLKITYHFSKGQAATVKASPNGGAVKENTVVQLTCATEGAQIQYSFDEGVTWIPYENGVKLETLPVSLQAKAVLEGFEESEVATFTYNKRTQEDYNVYFGQIHSHTSYSDGAGSAEQAFKHARDEADQIDFLAITDHSNSFDNDTSATIKDGSASSEWVEGHKIADQYTNEETTIIVNEEEKAESEAELGEASEDEDAEAQAAEEEDYFVGIMGYEMTWSGGAPGHMNTFNTDGFMSRNMTGYGNGSKASLTNYYAQLKTVPEGFSMFNHPGTTFGDFYDFGYYDEEIDNYITLVEVGNGEGAIGSSGYFPSYEYYTRALDKGWHVAPTNDQDNHKGKWGDANTGRTVILADSLTRDNIYDALRNMRVYATEDNDLRIQYTMNGMDMGYIYEDAPESCNIVVKLEDPTDSKIGKVEVIVNNGLSVVSEEVSDSSATLNFHLDPKYSYYYIRVTQPDGDKAVTAPIWVSDVEALGISSFTTDASLEVKDEPINLSLGLYNNEDKDFEVDSIIYTVNGEVIHKTDLDAAGLKSIGAKKEATDTFAFTYDKVGKVTIEATLIGKLNGVSKTYTKDLELTYIDPSMVTRVIVDGTHHNDYVTGYYGGNVGNFADIAAQDNVQINVVKDEITKEMLEDCSLLIVSAPAKKSGTFDGKNYEASHFEDSFVELVKDYAAAGGNVVFCGLADYQDTEDSQSSTEINRILSAIGATTRLNSDEIVDDDNNGGQKYRLYFDDFNMASPYLKGVVSGQTYSAYSGASVLVGDSAEALVYGHDTTYSIDSKTFDDQYKAVDKGNIVALAHETLASGSNIFVAGTVFLSDFEVKTDLDNASDTYYANRNILLNILGNVQNDTPISTIAQMRAGNKGDIFAIEGYVTAGNSNPDTTFFDTIYVQDETGGTTVFPFSDTDGTVEIGTKIRIIGFVDDYQGDKEIQIISSKILDGEKHIYEPQAVTAREAMDYDQNGGSLLQVTGTVTKVVTNSSGVDYFYLKDSSGQEARIFIDGYILASDGKDTVNEDVKVGNTITAVGLCYMNPDGTCLRVRDRAEIVLGTADAANPDTSADVKDQSAEKHKSKGKSNKANKGKVAVATINIAEQLVPLMDSLPTLDNKQTYHFMLTSDCELKAQLFKEYANLKGYLLSSMSGKAGVRIDMESFMAANMDLNLKCEIKKQVDFAPGFDTTCMTVFEKTKLPFTININICVDASNAGKTAYIFVKDIDTNVYQLQKVMTVNEIGNVDVDTDNFANIMVMVAQ